MQELYTKEAISIPDIPWNVYPKPQMKRRRWLCLNGMWQLSAGGEKQPDPRAFLRREPAVRGQNAAEYRRDLPLQPQFFRA